MTGFRYLLVSIVLIALATLVSANYRTYGRDATMEELFSVGPICQALLNRQVVPLRIDCEDNRDEDLGPKINFNNDNRVMR